MKSAVQCKGLLPAALVALFALGLPSEAHCQKKSKTKSNVQSRLKSKAVVYSDGANSTSHLYESSDGVRVRRTGEQFSSPWLANERLTTKLRNANRVIERNPVFEKKRKVGERVVAVFVNQQSKEETVSIMGTYGVVFWSIDAPSLRHALAFESWDDR